MNGQKIRVGINGFGRIGRLVLRAGLSRSDVWYCGDSVKADVYGAQGAGIYPVLYEEKNTGESLRPDHTTPDIPFPHLHIHSWTEMITLLESLRPETSEIQF